jgi:hypothetical protein
MPGEHTYAGFRFLKIGGLRKGNVICRMALRSPEIPGRVAPSG